MKVNFLLTASSFRDSIRNQLFKKIQVSNENLPQLFDYSPKTNAIPKAKKNYLKNVSAAFCLLVMITTVAINWKSYEMIKPTLNLLNSIHLESASVAYARLINRHLSEDI